MDKKELLETYLAEAATYSALRRDQERDLVQQVHDGDKSALRKLMHSYLELIALLAIKLTPEDRDPIEAIQEANVAMWEVLQDPYVDEPVLRLFETVQRAVSASS